MNMPDIERCPFCRSMAEAASNIYQEIRCGVPHDKQFVISYVKCLNCEAAVKQVKIEITEENHRDIYPLVCESRQIAIMNWNRRAK